MRRYSPSVLLPFLAFVVLCLALPSGVAAYSGTCHAHLTDEAALIFGFPELNDYLDKVAEGAKCEDNIDHIYSDENVCGHTVRHFWDADDSDNFQQNNCMGYDYVNAWVKGRRLVDRANELFYSWVTNGSYADLDSAYHYLGHVCHLIGDMGVPAHVHIDYHPNDPLDDDCYEDWFGQHDCESCPALCLNWNYENALAKWGQIHVGTGNAISIRDYLGDDCWEPWQLQASYYYLAYTTNQRSDYFASDSYDGDTDDRLGLVGFSGFPSAPTVSDDLDDNDDDPDNDAHGHLSTIADYCYTRAMCATAAWYEVWRDYWDPEKPTTEMDINGPDEVHDGWRPDDVYVGLIGDDDAQGASLYNSGVHEVQWKRSGEDWHTVPGYVAVAPITDEGVTTLAYRSMDRFANLEFQNSAIFKIDKTPPEVAIISPEPDGFYLTSGSLTIDYEATDVPSGVWGLVADMDGEPVTDGQVFDDLTQMAGFHTVTVTAEDFAGNTTTVSVTFSIKIDATIEISPEPMNTKSMATAMKAEIGFPPEYDVNLIDVTRVTLAVGGQAFPAKLSPTTIGAYGPDGLPTLLLEFERRDVCAVLQGVTAYIEMIVEGWLTDPIEFYGADTTEVFTPSRTKLGAPTHLVIEGASPNPVGGSAVISFGLPRDGRVEIDVYDVSGRLVTNLAKRGYAAGYHTVEWQTEGSVANGVYLVRLRLGLETITSKTVVWR
jgi:hypothetical protein